jgi:hypothetical protein
VAIFSPTLVHIVHGIGYDFDDWVQPETIDAAISIRVLPRRASPIRDRQTLLQAKQWEVLLVATGLDQAIEILKVVGLVGAGVWAAWTFHRLQRTRAAEIAINKELAETERASIGNAEARRNLISQQPVMNIELHVSEHALATKKCELALCVEANIRNEGKQDFKLSFDAFALTVARVEPSVDERPVLKNVKHFGAWYFKNSGEFEPIGDRRFRVGSARRLALATLPVSKGVYLIQFLALCGFRRSRPGIPI